MHERGLTRRLLRVVEEEARARQLTRVKRVRLETGVLSETERDTVRFNFKTAAYGTVAQDAELDFDEHPVKAICPACLTEALMTCHDQACASCQAWPLSPVDGETFRITELVAT